MLNTEHRNPEHYKWGLFYFDPNDPAMIVPKRNWGMGWTFNFGNKSTYLLIVGIVAIVIVLNMFLL